MYREARIVRREILAERRGHFCHCAQDAELMKRADVVFAEVPGPDDSDAHALVICPGLP
jgi:hypothetical protein